ncbi:type II toxin-antitoxin system VapC family toxin [Pyrodictium abyssi]|uniref:Type II toxin-antitoxin system VapC family toxin n=1 Tax=Pyrodictium abyssi TaxID=54256 RepID=A0ABN6ZLT2_9CREN|nr:type II toxin-antitoxin system VapC family toxin [Pyrodictium abyssi]
MSRRVFIDSSVFIEYGKNNPDAVRLVRRIMELAATPCINAIVFSEALYIHIRERSGKPPEALKRNPGLVRSVNLDDVERALFSCVVLEEDAEILKEAASPVKDYGLLPNDALILATAKRFGSQLATMDEYLKEVARRVGVDVVE